MTVRTVSHSNEVLSINHRNARMRDLGVFIVLNELGGEDIAKRADADHDVGQRFEPGGVNVVVHKLNGF